MILIFEATDYIRIIFAVHNSGFVREISFNLV